MSVSTLPASGVDFTRHQARRRLFVASLLFLFLELALIRWLPAQVLFLTFFTNTVLLASFLGFSLGCLVARSRFNYLSWTPALLLCCIAAGAGTESLRLSLQDIINVGNNKSSPQVVYFGTEVRVHDVASVVVPIEAVMAFFFVLTVATLVGVGQTAGRSIRAVEDPVKAYFINLTGSLAGILLFHLSAIYLPPVCWFAGISLGLVYLLVTDNTRASFSIALALAVPVVLYIPDAMSLGVIQQRFPVEVWSPYYRINYSPESRVIVANLIGQQTMVSRNDPYPAYALPYLINRDTQADRFRRILIIGAGSGNDVSRAVQWAHPDATIDAVEIDPVIFSFGKKDHPDRPYDDPRVSTYITDGRNFLRSTDRQYDLIVFALIDSLVLHSSVSNIRLESYLFTEEAMEDVRRRLSPNGLFVMYNYFRQGWIVSRLNQTVAKVFGQPPLVLTLPQQEVILPDTRADAFTVLFAGKRALKYQEAFSGLGQYTVPAGVPLNESSTTGFNVPATGQQLRINPSVVSVPGDIQPATDSWPFLYVRKPMLPALLWRGMLVIGLFSLAALRFFGWRTGSGQLTWPNAAMFLLGAGFMLMETKAVVQLALVFGSTWTVNTAVFGGIIIVVLFANLFVAKRQLRRLTPYYAGLFVTLMLNVLIPLNAVLGLPVAIRAIVACAVAVSPVFFAAVIFTALLRRHRETDQAFAYNSAGAVLGGIAETTSLWIGFQYLTLVAATLYFLAWAVTNYLLREENVSLVPARSASGTATPF